MTRVIISKGVIDRTVKDQEKVGKISNSRPFPVLVLFYEN